METLTTQMYGPGIARLARDVHLGGQGLHAGRPDGKVDMRRAPGIGPGPDGAKAVGGGIVIGAHDQVEVPEVQRQLAVVVADG